MVIAQRITLSNLTVNFGGGNLTSDAGMLLYKEFDGKIGFSKAIKDNLNIDLFIVAVVKLFFKLL